MDIIQSSNAIHELNTMILRHKAFLNECLNNIKSYENEFIILTSENDSTIKLNSLINIRKDILLNLTKFDSQEQDFKTSFEMSTKQYESVVIYPFHISNHVSTNHEVGIDVKQLMSDSLTLTGNIRSQVSLSDDLRRLITSIDETIVNQILKTDIAISGYSSDNSLIEYTGPLLMEALVSNGIKRLTRPLTQICTHSDDIKVLYTDKIVSGLFVSHRKSSNGLDVNTLIAELNMKEVDKVINYCQVVENCNIMPFVLPNDKIYNDYRSLNDIMNQLDEKFDKLIGLDLIISILRKVAYLHLFEITHKDITKDNIYLNKDGLVMLGPVSLSTEFSGSYLKIYDLIAILDLIDYILGFDIQTVCTKSLVEFRELFTVDNMNILEVSAMIKLALMIK